MKIDVCTLRFLLICSVCIALSGCQKQKRIPLISVEKLEQRARFDAIVLRVEDFPDFPAGAFVIVYLKTEGGDKFGVLGEKRDDIRQFATNLVTGKTYEFPKVWLEYKAKSGIDRSRK